MMTIAGFLFDTSDGALQMLDSILAMKKEQTIILDDIAIVSWAKGEKKPNTSDLATMNGENILSGAFWGMFFGFIFFTPHLGMAFAAITGAMSGKFAKYGIGKHFITRIHEQVVEGTSALFILGSNNAVQKIADEAKRKGWRIDIITAELTEEQVSQLRNDFGTKIIGSKGDLK